MLKCKGSEAADRVGHSLGSSGSGLYYLAFSLMVFCSTLSSLGLGNAVPRLIGAQDGAASSGRSAVLRSGLALTPGASILVVIAVHVVGIGRTADLFEGDGLGNLFGIMLLSVLLIPPFGMAGAAIGWTVSVVSESVLGLTFVRRDLGILSLPGLDRGSRAR